MYGCRFRCDNVVAEWQIRIVSYRFVYVVGGSLDYNMLINKANKLDRRLAKVGVASSNLVSRSKLEKGLAEMLSPFFRLRLRILDCANPAAGHAGGLRSNRLRDSSFKGTAGGLVLGDRIPCNRVRGPRIVIYKPPTCVSLEVITLPDAAPSAEPVPPPRRCAAAGTGDPETPRHTPRCRWSR